MAPINELAVMRQDMVEFFKKSPVLVLTAFSLTIGLFYVFVYNKSQDNKIRSLKTEMHAISNKIRVADTLFLYTDEPFPATKEEFEHNKREMQEQIALKTNVINFFIIKKFDTDETLRLLKYITLFGFIIWAVRRIYYNSKTLV